MEDNTVLQKFRQFRAMIVDANIPADVLLEMAENYMTSEDSETAVAEAVPVLDGQLSLFDAAA